MTQFDRRTFMVAALGATAVARLAAQAPATQPQISPVPTTRDWSRLEPIAYPDPDIVALDRRRSGATSSSTPSSSGCTSGRCGRKGRRGTASAVSGLERHPEQRADALDRTRTATSPTFRSPSGYSNGNTFDYEGRQLSCEHGGRRVARYERDGTVTIDRRAGSRASGSTRRTTSSSHPDGGIWFTDPFYGIRGNYEGFKAEQEIEGSGLSRGSARPGRSRRSPTKSVSRTASASRRTTRSSTSPTPACRATSRSGTWTARRCATASGSFSSTFQEPARPRPPTEFAATRMATSGQARGRACRWSRRRASASA